MSKLALQLIETHRTALDTEIHTALVELLNIYTDKGKNPQTSLVKNFLTPAQNLATGGKRLRANLLISSYLAHKIPLEVPEFNTKIAETTIPNYVYQAAAALEIFQLHALIHDDLIDQALTRRGFPAAHIFFAETAANSSNDPAHFGNGSAILLGDLLLAYAHYLLAKAINSAIAAKELHARCAQTAHLALSMMSSQVAVGQYFDFHLEQQQSWKTPLASPISPINDQKTTSNNSSHLNTDNTDLQSQIDAVMINKTASYSTTYPLLLGALFATNNHPYSSSPTANNENHLANHSFATLPSLIADYPSIYSFGQHLGIAFQLRDDFLGMFGDPQVTGKPVGEDLRAGKMTHLLRLTLENLRERRDNEPSHYAWITETIGKSDLSKDEIHNFQQLAQDCGAVSIHEKLLNTHLEKAQAALNGLECAPAGRQLLASFAALICQRNF